MYDGPRPEGGRIVRTPEDADACVRFFAELSPDQIVGFDVETDTRPFWTGNSVRTVQFGTERYGFHIPMMLWGYLARSVWDLLLDKRQTLAAHACQFDLLHFKAMGWRMPRTEDVHDTEVLLRLRNNALPAALKGRHTAMILGGWATSGKDALKARARELGLAGPNKVPGYGGDKYWPAIPWDDPVYAQYGVMDTCLTALLCRVLLEKRGAHYLGEPYETEMRYKVFMMGPEFRGMLVDRAYTERLAEEYRRAIIDDETLLRDLGLDNPRSRQQTVALLKDFGWVPTEFTDSGEPALDKRIKSQLMAAGGMTGDAVEVVTRYERRCKWKAVYLDHFLDGADWHGRVHPNINTMEATTGRSSIRHPALQTLPSGEATIRRCLRPEPGHRWYSLDFSNQEPRFIAHFGQSPALLDLFRQEGGGSIHDFVASSLFGQYTQEQRTMAKIFGLSRAYGAGPESMAVTLGESVDYIKATVARYDELVGLDRLKQEIYEENEGRRDKYTETFGGRRVYARRGEEHKLVNYKIQGSGANSLKRAVLRLDEAGLGEFVILPVHDEVCFSFPADEGQGLAQEAAKIMEERDITVPIPVGIEGPGKTWGHCVKS